MMLTQPLKRALAATLCAIFGLGVATAAPPDHQTEGTLFQQKIEELHALRRQRLELTQQQRDEIHGLRADIDRLNQTLRSVRGESQHAETEVAALRDELERQRLAVDASRSIISAAATAAAPVADSVAERIASGIPWQQSQRIAAIDGIRADLTRDDPVIRAGAVTRLAEFLGEELRHAASRELIALPVDLVGGQRRVDAYQLRLGLINQVFIAEDGSAVGVASKDASLWRTDLSAEARKAVRLAIEQVRQTKPPGLVVLPVVVRDVEPPAPSEAQP